MRQQQQQHKYDAAPTTTLESRQDQDVSPPPLPSHKEESRLSLWQGILLVTAECVGVGILALPHNVHSLGGGTTGGAMVGLGFLILNLPINFVAGNYLSGMAMELELEMNSSQHNQDPQQPHEQERQRQVPSEQDDDDEKDDNLHHDVVLHENNEVELSSILSIGRQTMSTTTSLSPLHHRQGHDPSILQRNVGLEEVFQDELESDEDVENYENHRAEKEENHGSPVYGSIHVTGNTPTSSPIFDFEDQHDSSNVSDNNNDNNTQDLVAMSRSIFQSRQATFVVIAFYYLNLFLVLGDYILVMGRAVSAVTLDWISCAPLAGAVASILMLGICQFRTMATLGRKVSLASLMAMLIVILQCLFHHRASGIDGGKNTTVGETTTSQDNDNRNEQEQEGMDNDVWSKFSAMAGIGFAVGSQKLFLNVRHELRHKEESSKVLAGSLTTYGSAYVLVILLAGSNPPSFLFDAIPDGWNRQIAGLLLWGHVAVSYAINSQALCSSIDRLLQATTFTPQRWRCWWEPLKEEQRWFVLTLTVALSSYLVSNAVPFFKDLVALIGALTSVPLTLTLPALLYRKFHRLRMFFPSWNRLRGHDGGGGENKTYAQSCGSYLLLIYSAVFLVIGLMGALSSIDRDWVTHEGGPFACRRS